MLGNGNTISNKQPDKDTKQVILQELYNEVRSYRDKEMQTFFFAFVVIGVGFAEDFARRPEVKILLSVFAAVVSIYLRKNLSRSVDIRQTIFKIQKSLGVDDEFMSPLRPSMWASKSRWRHLGTSLYILVLVAEVIALWLTLWTT